MRWNDKTPLPRKRYDEWHEVIPLVPIQMSGKWVWLETIERRGVKQVHDVIEPGSWQWEFEYRDRTNSLPPQQRLWWH